MSRFTSRESSGQALVETTIGLFLVVVCVVGGLVVFRAQWRRAKCAYLAFEAAHLALTGRSTLSLQTRSWNLPDRVIAEAQCVELRERVELPKLEYARW